MKRAPRQRTLRAPDKIDVDGLAAYFRRTGCDAADIAEDGTLRAIFFTRSRSSAPGEMSPSVFRFDDGTQWTLVELDHLVRAFLRWRYRELGETWREMVDTNTRGRKEHGNYKKRASGIVSAEDIERHRVENFATKTPLPSHRPEDRDRITPVARIFEAAGFTPANARARAELFQDFDPRSPA